MPGTFVIAPPSEHDVLVTSRLRNPVLLTAVALVGVLVAAYNLSGWSTVCELAISDGRRVIVTCHRLPATMDARYHYYMTLEPRAEFRPLAVSASTLKQGGSAAKPWARVEQRWATRHYLGYLRGFDGIEERQPAAVTSSGNEIVLSSRDGIVGRFEIR